MGHLLDILLSTCNCRVQSYLEVYPIYFGGSVRKSVFISTAAPPNLTVDGAVRVVEGVWNWRSLGHWLSIPESKHGESVKDLMTYWMTTDPFPSWRRLIRALYASGEKGIADSVRHYAEPLAGTSFELSDR